MRASDRPAEPGGRARFGPGHAASVRGRRATCRIRRGHGGSPDRTPTTDHVPVPGPFYWNRDDATRRFTRRMFNGRMPTTVEAGVYSATLAALHAARAANSVAGHEVAAALRRGPIPDPLLGTVTVRPDGVAAHDMPVYRVKRPDQSRARWDDYAPVATIPAAEAFGPPDDRCAAAAAGRRAR